MKSEQVSARYIGRPLTPVPPQCKSPSGIDAERGFFLLCIQYGRSAELIPKFEKLFSLCFVLALAFYTGRWLDSEKTRVNESPDREKGLAQRMATGTAGAYFE